MPFCDMYMLQASQSIGLNSMLKLKWWRYDFLKGKVYLSDVSDVSDDNIKVYQNKRTG